MAKGTIIKALSGFYYVADGAAVVRCKPRGVFRHEGLVPLVGDGVIYEPNEQGDGTITRLLERRNSLVRPPVANIDNLLIVISAATPVADPFVIDRMTMMAERYAIEPIICLNKTDLDAGEELCAIYSGAGFKICSVSAATGEGLDALKALLCGSISAFAGNSGVGKSSLINRLCPQLAIQTGEVSDKLGRGRHTTRHVELYPMPGGGMLADTPGFSFFDPQAGDLPAAGELWRSFREFKRFEGLCRYQDCSHTKEAGCAILGAVKAGEISPSRHQSYLRLYEECKKIHPWDKPKTSAH